MNAQAKQMIKALKHWYCPDNLKDEPGIKQMIADVYNEAMRDTKDFIETMAQRNPAHRALLTGLIIEMFPGMTIGDYTK